LGNLPDIYTKYLKKKEEGAFTVNSYSRGAGLQFRTTLASPKALAISLATFKEFPVPEKQYIVVLIIASGLRNSYRGLLKCNNLGLIKQSVAGIS
jgi:hypothetical protein